MSFFISFFCLLGLSTSKSNQLINIKCFTWWRIKCYIIRYFWTNDRIPVFFLTMSNVIKRFLSSMGNQNPLIGYGWIIYHRNQSFLFIHANLWLYGCIDLCMLQNILSSIQMQSMVTFRYFINSNIRKTFFFIGWKSYIRTVNS